MRIEKAIETLELEYSKREIPFDADYYDALCLGIEALKTIKAERTIYGFKRQGQLPGETKE